MANGCSINHTCRIQTLKIRRNIEKKIQDYVFIIFCLCCINTAFSQKKIPVKIQGSANVQLRYYSITKGTDTRPPFVANINAQPVFTIGKWTINSRFVIGNYQTQFRDFNRYGIAPQYKWMKFYLGHNTLNWSQFALEARPVLGAGFEMNPGKIHYGVYAGYINRKALQDTFRSRIFSPTFSRKMMAIKVGYGRQSNFIDIIILTAADKASSLTPLEALGNTPASNGVLAIKGSKELTKSIVFAADIAYSAYTGNTNGKGDELVNKSLAKIPATWIKTNSSTQLLGAYSAEIKYNLPAFKFLKKEFGAMGLSFDYNRIEPGYQSMGLYFLVNDIERTKVGLMLKSKNQKIQFNGNIGYEHNDLFKTQFFKNKRFINGINIVYRPNTNWNYMATMQNFAVQLLIDGISANDSLLINQVNRNYSVSANGLLGNKNAATNSKSSIMASFGYQSGKNITSSTTTRNLGHTYLQVNYSPSTTDGKWHLAGGYNMHHYVFFKTKSTRHIPSAGFDKSWKANKYRIHFETGLILTWVSKKYTSTGWRNSFSGLWNIDKKSFLQTSALLQPNVIKNNNLMEIQVDLRYGYRF